jgi:hypothetical protein
MSKNFAEMNKKFLLVLATEKEIVGRHDMTKQELVEALEDAGETLPENDETDEGDEEYEGDTAGAGDADEIDEEVEQELKTGRRLCWV